MRALLALAVFAIPAFAAPVPKALKKKSSAADGTWKVVEWHVQQSRMQMDEDIFWTIEGEKLTVEGRNGAPAPGNFIANVTRTIVKKEGGGANDVDYIITPTDSGAVSVRPAVLEVTEGTLKVHLSTTHNGPRPADCTPGQGVLYVLKRVDAAK